MGPAARVELKGPDWELATTVSVASGPTRVIELLPMAQAFADAVVDSAVKMVEARGERVSCAKGCGACCRQLVPIAEAEARRIRDLVEALPEPRRSEVRTGFARARRALTVAGLLDTLEHREDWGDEEGRTIGVRYFALGIPCPFLEDECCSIYADRPIACREYLVTSPPEHCARPTAETVACVKLPLKVWTAVARLAELSPSARFIRWVPLVLACEWAETHPDDSPAQRGPELLRQFFEHLTDKRESRTSPWDP